MEAKLQICQSVLLFAILLFPALCRAQPSLGIVITPQNAIVAPGSSFTVNLNATGMNGDPSGVLATDYHFKIQQTAPLQFQVSVPIDVSLGTYNLTALAQSPTDPVVQSPSVAFTVVNGTAYAKLQIPISAITLLYPGRTYRLIVSGVDLTGNTQRLSRSGGLSFQSSNVAIAAVDALGTIVGVAPGTAIVTASYQRLITTLSVTVRGKNALLGDLNGDGVVDISDLNELTAFLNGPANGPNDARDLNHDGKIDAIDARILVTLCTYPRCVTHP